MRISGSNLPGPQAIDVERDVGQSREGLRSSQIQLKGLLRFDIIDEDGWQWTVLHLDKETKSLEVLGLDEEARAAVNDRQNRFSWTKDGRRDIDGKKVLFQFHSSKPNVVAALELVG
jgi:hypothetical protein